MKSNKKILSLVTIFLLLVLSFMTPLAVAATPTPLAYITDHSFSEEYWGILYDFAGLNIEKDYTPGTYSGMSLDPTYGQAGDNLTDTDSKFWITYTNIGNVQSIYMAMQNFSWDLDSGYNSSKYGCAPLQFLVQHFTPEGNPFAHVFVVNRFLGLMAYEDNKTDGDEGIPDDSDKMFIGWAFYSGFFKYYINQLFKNDTIPEYARIDNSTQTEAIPINITKTSSSGEVQYTYGMSYKNLFVAWQNLSATQGADQTNINLGNFVAASIIKELNFTYVTTLKSSSTAGSSIVETRVKYDIGNMTDLWIFGESNGVANYFGGNHYPLDSIENEVAYYNTTNAIKSRLSGNETHPGFSLGIINTANIMTISLSSLIGSSQNNFVNPLGTILGDITTSIGKAINKVGGKPAYEIDFTSTQNYTLDGETDHESNTLVINKSKIITPMEFAGAFKIAYFLAGLIGNYTGNTGLIASAIMSYVLSKLSVTSFYYITCFPEWAGGTIEQDPTFTAYTGTFTGFGVPGYELVIVSIAGLMGITYVIMKTRQKKKQIRNQLTITIFFFIILFFSLPKHIKIIFLINVISIQSRNI